jgi:hypothetical protein
MDGGGNDVTIVEANALDDVAVALQHDSMGSSGKLFAKVDQLVLF